MPWDSYDEATDAEVCDVYDQMLAAMASAHKCALEAAAALDKREAWRQDGATSMSAWMQARSGLSKSTALEWVRVANALPGLPAITETFFDGAISFDQLRSLTWFAEPDTDEQLAREGPACSASYLELRARRARLCSLDEELAKHGDRFLELRMNPREGLLKIWGRLPAEERSLVAKAIDRIADHIGSETPPEERDSSSRRRADALVELCRANIADDHGAARACLVVHTDAATLSGHDGLAELDDATRLSTEAVMRLCCDARLELVVEQAIGGELTHREPIGIGRASRTIPPHLMRLLRYRDEHCVWPGCVIRRFCEGHHLVWWSKGGKTDLDNLLLLCGGHHKAVHERGFKITGHPERGLHFFKPDGSPVRKGPVAMSPQVRERLWGRTAGTAIDRSGAGPPDTC